MAILLVLLPWWLAATPHSEDVNGPLQRRTEDRLAESDEDAGLEPFSDDDLGRLESEDWLDLPPLAEADAQPKGGGRGTCVEEEDATEHDDKATVEPEDAVANDNDMDAGEKGVVADDQPDQHAVPMPQQEQDAADEADDIPDAGHEPERLKPPAGIALDDEGAWDLGEAARRAREAHEDCPACDGKGFRYARCKNRMCARGTVRGYQHQVIGVHPLTGDPIIQRIPIRVPCPICRGNHITKTKCSRCWGRGVP